MPLHLVIPTPSFLLHIAENLNNAPSYPCTFVSSPYCGKPNEDRENYIKGTNAIIQKVIDFKAFHVDLKGRNLSFDRYYTSNS